MDAMKVDEVSRALLDSEKNLAVKGKLSIIVGKQQIAARSAMVHWPSVEASSLPCHQV